MLKKYYFKFVTAYKKKEKCFKILKLKIERKKFKGNELITYIKIFNIQFIFCEDLISNQN